MTDITISKERLIAIMSDSGYDVDAEYVIMGDVVALNFKHRMFGLIQQIIYKKVQ